MIHRFEQVTHRKIPTGYAPAAPDQPVPMGHNESRYRLGNIPSTYLRVRPILVGDKLNIYVEMYLKTNRCMLIET